MRKRFFVARCKVDDAWVTIGTGWEEDGGAVTVKLSKMPPGWDGRLELLKPMADGKWRETKQ
jgi:hypothetical protein